MNSRNLDALLACIRAYLDSSEPQLRPLFEVMAAEAVFARDWLYDDLAQLPSSAALLEVGGGVFILSCQLASEGFAVTAIEPTGDGFGAFKQLGDIVLALAPVKPNISRCMAEDFASKERFDFAFSVNVMEHVDSPAEVITRISNVLKTGAKYRFLCPNYIFPYEPHFNIPTSITKHLTWRVMSRRIMSNPRVDDPIGLWQSINWITVAKVRRFAASDPRLTAYFRRTTLVWMLERALDDDEFARRRAPWMISIIRAAVAVRLHYLASYLPAVLQPIMDVSLTKRQ